MTPLADQPSSTIQSSPLSGGALKEAGGVHASMSEALRGAALTAPRWFFVIGSLGLVTILVGLVCLQFGVERIGLSDIGQIVRRAVSGGEINGEAAVPTGTILVQVRLPRVLLGFLVGSCLASVGVALQALLRNPLADPYVLGVSSGAALGASVGILFGIGSTFLAEVALPACGFAGGLLALFVVYRLAASYERLPIHSLLLAGVILNAIFSALIMFITSIMEPNRSFGVMAWLMGTLSAPAYPTLMVLSLYLLFGLFLLFKQARVLNILALGEESARSLGVDTEKTKRFIFILAALVTGAVVSISGMIGFIGMVIPHTVRLLLGADHRLLMPASALTGGMFLMGADTVARTLLSPAEIPVGIVTALSGGPFFVYLLLWRKDRLA
jgi:iron complex transport system permease protein